MQSSKIKETNSEINNKSLNIFLDKDTISGEISLNLSHHDIQNFDHQGITIELLGVMTTSDGYKSEFLHLTKDLEGSGTLTKDVSYGFSFKEVDLPYESYKGKLVNIQYLLKASIAKNFLNIKSKETLEIKVIKIRDSPILISSLNTEICHASFLSLDFYLQENKVNVKDVVLGSLLIKTINIITKSVVLVLVKREILLGKLPLFIIGNRYEDTVITNFEISEGPLEENDVLPIRLYLSSYNLSPSYENVNNIFSVKYFLKLVIIEEIGKEYSYHEEIIFYS